MTNSDINAGAGKQRRQCFCLWKKPLFLGAGTLGKNKTDFINLAVIPARRACGSCIVLRPTYKGLITGDGVNFRSNHYLTASVGGQLQRGDVLTVDRQFDGTDYTWYHGIVESASSLELIGDGGWVAHSFIRLI